MRTFAGPKAVIDPLDMAVGETLMREVIPALFVRDAKLSVGKAAPFMYYGQIRYLRHDGSAAMSVVWELLS